MHISSVTVRNYRSLKDVTVRVSKYGVFIGANGSGKSSLLYALDWFFNGTSLAESDVHGYKEDSPLPLGSTVEVAVSFSGLTTKDRDRLKQYGRGERAVIRRTWYADTKQVKTVGNAKQGPGFAEVRADQSIAARRRAYRELQSVHSSLPDLGGSASKDAIFEALEMWEMNPSNEDNLIDVADSDATQMMGWNGPNVIRECVRFVLIPAATSIAGEVGTASKGSALTELVGAFMSAASVRAQSAWLEKHAEAVSELSVEISKSINDATGVQANRINSRLASLIPNAAVKLTPTVPEFAPKVDPTIATAVTIDGITNDVSLQGHGVQRAVMISMFQAIVPDEDLARSSHTPKEDEDANQSQSRLEESLAELPAIILAVEEPEIYQHPIRARAFARTLFELSNQSNVQVLLASHSPYFVQPEQFHALHRFTYVNGESDVRNATVASVAERSDIDAKKVEKSIISQIPTEFSEGFFADAVVLVEGQTDRIVIEALATKLDKHLDRRGITVLSVEGKGGLRVSRAILSSLGVPTYVVVDGDYGTAARRTYQNKKQSEVHKARAQAHESHRSATTDLVSALPATATVLQGALPYTFGEDTVVCGDFTIWKDDIEEELAAWGSFERALADSGVSLAARTNKNLLAYRNAVFSAELVDLPGTLQNLIAAVCSLVPDAGHPDKSLDFADIVANDRREPKAPSL